MDDVSIIREILAVTHVPVVAQLQWEKLQSLLRSVCDRLTTNTARLEKAEELAKRFQAFKDEIYEVCKTTVQECKDFTEIEVQKQAEKLEILTRATEDRLDNVEKGVVENNRNIKSVREDLVALKSSVESLPKRVEDLEIGVKSLNEASTELRDKVAEQGAALQKQSEAFQTQFDQHVMETTGAVRVLTEEIEALQADVLDHSDRIQKVENKADDLKIQVQQTTQSHAAEIDALNKHSQALRQELDTKLVAAPELKPGQRRPSAIMADLGNAVTDLQSRLQTKADTTALEQLTQANKDSLQRVNEMVEDLRQQQQRRGSQAPQPPSRRSSKLSSLLAGGTKGMVTDYVADEVRESLKDHDKMIEGIHRDMSFLGKTVLIMSGHDKRYLPQSDEDHVESPATAAAPAAAGAPVAPADVPAAAPSPAAAAVPAAAVVPAGAAPPAAAPAVELKSGLPPLPPNNSAAAYEEIFYTFEKALREHHIQPKEDLIQMKQLQTLVEGMRETKAEKKDMQKIARIVREFMEQPEHVVFSGKPLLGFKCMSCDQDIPKLNPLRADYLPHGSMPKQVLPMMSAERLFSPNGGSPRTPGRLSHRGNNSPYSSKLPRKSFSAGNANTLSKPL